MVPVIVHRIGTWLDQFADTLGYWENLLCELRSAYFRQDTEAAERLSRSIESAKAMMLASKSDRESILTQAQEQGFHASNLRELSRLLDSQWPALWTHRLLGLESQISRIQQLGVSLWIHSMDSRDLVSEMLQLLGAKSPKASQETRKDQAVGNAELEKEPVILSFDRRAA